MKSLSAVSAIEREHSNVCAYKNHRIPVCMDEYVGPHFFFWLLLNLAFRFRAESLVVLWRMSETLNIAGQVLGALPRRIVPRL